MTFPPIPLLHENGDKKMSGIHITIVVGKLFISYYDCKSQKYLITDDFFHGTLPMFESMDHAKAFFLNKGIRDESLLDSDMEALVQVMKKLQLSHNNNN